MNKILLIKKKLKELAAAQKRNYNDLLLEFALERVICRLIQNKYISENFIFKGGFVVYKNYGGSRFTRDIDVLDSSNSREKIITNVTKSLIHPIRGDDFWFGEIKNYDLFHIENYPGIRFEIRYMLGEKPPKQQKAPKLHLDVGFGDYLTKPLKIQKLQSIIVKEDLSWKVYPIETIIAEKLEALIKRGSVGSRAKDVYDLTQLLPKIHDIPELLQAVKSTFHKRQTPLPKSFSESLLAMDINTLMSAWNSVEIIGAEITFNSIWEKLLKLIKVLDE